MTRKKRANPAGFGQPGPSADSGRGGPSIGFTNVYLPNGAVLQGHISDFEPQGARGRNQGHRRPRSRGQKRNANHKAKQQARGKDPLPVIDDVASEGSEDSEDSEDDAALEQDEVDDATEYMSAVEVISPDSTSSAVHVAVPQTQLGKATAGKSIGAPKDPFAPQNLVAAEHASAAKNLVAAKHDFAPQNLLAAKNTAAPKKAVAPKTAKAPKTAVVSKKNTIATKNTGASKKTAQTQPKSIPKTPQKSKAPQASKAPKVPTAPKGSDVELSVAQQQSILANSGWWQYVSGILERKTYVNNKPPHYWAFFGSKYKPTIMPLQQQFDHMATYFNLDDALSFRHWPTFMRWEIERDLPAHPPIGVTKDEWQLTFGRQFVESMELYMQDPQFTKHPCTDDMKTILKTLDRLAIDLWSILNIWRMNQLPSTACRTHSNSRPFPYWMIDIHPLLKLFKRGNDHGNLPLLCPGRHPSTRPEIPKEWPVPYTMRFPIGHDPAAYKTFSNMEIPGYKQPARGIVIADTRSYQTVIGDLKDKVDLLGDKFDQAMPHNEKDLEPRTVDSDDELESEPELRPCDKSDSGVEMAVENMVDFTLPAATMNCFFHPDKVLLWRQLFPEEQLPAGMWTEETVDRIARQWHFVEEAVRDPDVAGSAVMRNLSPSQIAPMPDLATVRRVVLMYRHMLMNLATTNHATSQSTGLPNTQARSTLPSLADPGASRESKALEISGSVPYPTFHDDDVLGGRPMSPNGQDFGLDDDVTDEDYQIVYAGWKGRHSNNAGEGPSNYARGLDGADSREGSNSGVRSDILELADLHATSSTQPNADGPVSHRRHQPGVVANSSHAPTMPNVDAAEEDSPETGSASDDGSSAHAVPHQDLPHRDSPNQTRAGRPPNRPGFQMEPLFLDDSDDDSDSGMPVSALFRKPPVLPRFIPPPRVSAQPTRPNSNQPTQAQANPVPSAPRIMRQRHYPVVPSSSTRANSARYVHPNARYRPASVSTGPPWHQARSAQNTAVPTQISPARRPPEGVSGLNGTMHERQPQSADVSARQSVPNDVQPSAQASSSAQMSPTQLDNVSLTASTESVEHPPAYREVDDLRQVTPAASQGPEYHVGSGFTPNPAPGLATGHHAGFAHPPNVSFGVYTTPGVGYLNHMTSTPQPGPAHQVEWDQQWVNLRRIEYHQQQLLQLQRQQQFLAMIGDRANSFSEYGSSPDPNSQFNHAQDYGHFHHAHLPGAESTGLPTYESHAPDMRMLHPELQGRDMPQMVQHPHMHMTSPNFQMEFDRRADSDSRDDLPMPNEAPPQINPYAAANPELMVQPTDIAMPPPNLADIQRSLAIQLQVAYQYGDHGMPGYHAQGAAFPQWSQPEHPVPGSSAQAVNWPHQMPESSAQAVNWQDQSRSEQPTAGPSGQNGTVHNHGNSYVSAPSRKPVVYTVLAHAQTRKARDECLRLLSAARLPQPTLQAQQDQIYRQNASASGSEVSASQATVSAQSGSNEHTQRVESHGQFGPIAPPIGPASMMQRPGPSAPRSRATGSDNIASNASIPTGPAQTTNPLSSRVQTVARVARAANNNFAATATESHDARAENDSQTGQPPRAPRNMASSQSSQRTRMMPGALPADNRDSASDATNANVNQNCVLM